MRVLDVFCLMPFNYVKKKKKQHQKTKNQNEKKTFYLNVVGTKKKINDGNVAKYDTILV